MELEKRKRMSLGIIKRIKKKSIEMDSGPCPTPHIVKTLTARKSSPPAKAFSPCEWNKREEYSTITAAYKFDSGMSECSEGNPSVVPAARQRMEVQGRHNSMELKRNKSLISSLPGKLNPIFKRKSSSSSLNETVSTSVQSEVPSQLSSNPSSYQTSMAKLKIPVEPSNASLYSLHSNSSSFVDENYTIVVDNNLGF